MSSNFGVAVVLGNGVHVCGCAALDGVAFLPGDRRDAPAIVDTAGA